MYFKNMNEFIEAIYHIYYSNLEENKKKNIIKQIYDEAIEFENNDEVTNLYQELYSNPISPQVDYDFINRNRGRVFSIQQLLNKNIKIHHLENANLLDKFFPIQNGQCLMCSSKNLYTYQGSFDEITYCRECVDFQNWQTNRFAFLIRNSSPTEDFNYKIPPTQLSTEQEKASDFLIDNYRKNKSSLVWAVCGAGKTEIIYKLIYTALQENKKICLAIPRKDVVKELSQRIERDFSLKMNILHGDEKILLSSNLFIMTCHQLYYYYKFFDLVIVDEVDAFPYNGNSVLEYAMKKSMKESANLVFLSATPSDKIKTTVDSIYKLPIRYHGALLPIPKVIIDKKLSKENISPSALKQIKDAVNKSLDKKRRLLIFAPTIEIGKQLAKETSYPFVHSQSDKREELVEDFRQRRFDILISSTILERGITLDYLDVFIYQADHEIFSKEALIQMAGRVGRKDYDTNGDIIFYVQDKNKTIKNSIKEIDYMNKLAEYRKLVKK